MSRDKDFHPSVISKRKAWVVFMHQDPIHLLANRLNTLSNDGYTVVSIFAQGRDLFIVAWREE